MALLPSDLANLWERYLGFVNLMITVCGGTVLVVTNKYLDLDSKELVVHPKLIQAAIVLAILAALGSIFWRAACQALMEVEVLGVSGVKRDDALAVTAAQKIGSSRLKLYKAVYWSCHIAVPLCISASWLIILWTFLADH